LNDLQNGLRKQIDFVYNSIDKICDTFFDLTEIVLQILFLLSQLHITFSQFQYLATSSFPLPRQLIDLTFQPRNISLFLLQSWIKILNNGLQIQLLLFKFELSLSWPTQFLPTATLYNEQLFVFLI